MLGTTLHHDQHLDVPQGVPQDKGVQPGVPFTIALGGTRGEHQEDIILHQDLLLDPQLVLPQDQGLHRSGRCR